MERSIPYEDEQVVPDTFVAAPLHSAAVGGHLPVQGLTSQYAAACMGRPGALPFAYNVKPPVLQHAPAAAPFVPVADAWMPVTSDTTRLAGTKRQAASLAPVVAPAPFALPAATTQVPALFFQAPVPVVPQQFDHLPLPPHALHQQQFQHLQQQAVPQPWAAPVAYPEKVMRSPEDPSYSHPDNEIRKRPRWETPRRRGNWREEWECAKELCDNVVPAAKAKGTSAAVRSVLSHVILSNVTLASATVDKWLNLLSEFLELNVDEHMLLLCLIRKYLKNGHSMASGVEYSRPQRWECVIGIGCFFAVMLSEEFPGRTGLDLRDLLGGNFNFARDQLRFLKAVDWRINVSAEEFSEAKAQIAEYEMGKASPSDMMKWLGARSSSCATDIVVVGAGAKTVSGGPEVAGKMPAMSLGAPECDMTHDVPAEVPEVPGM
ncbi:hypothetical protein FVE85_6870 [Porphyridium purpureum]|uniref:Uncharacterized protein n=1 Tax=Porphyridium purpureum TaxID=35688 RepID=A0A5J4Z7H0_PORPP|nr:hypothetical protein FVE85_6870 [Porphyridium purpureum]|eukprot:POR7688..scf295_1